MSDFGHVSLDVLCVGHACYDLTFSAAFHPGPDEKCVAEGFLGCGGGPAANAAVQSARLGSITGFLGYLGSDLFGDLHLAELEEEGVLTQLVVRGSAPTPVACIIVKPDGSRSVLNYHGSTPELTSDLSLPESVRPKVLLFDGHEPGISVGIAGEARRRGIKTILDAGSVNAGTLALIEIVDIVIASERFARDFTGGLEPRQALRALPSSPCGTVITLGSDGLVWKLKEEEGRLPAFSADVIDTTGAGDAFHGAFASALAKKMEWRDCLIFASAAGSLCCTGTGARPSFTHVPGIEELLRNSRPAGDCSVTS